MFLDAQRRTTLEGAMKWLEEDDWVDVELVRMAAHVIGASSFPFLGPNTPYLLGGYLLQKQYTTLLVGAILCYECILAAKPKCAEPDLKCAESPDLKSVVHALP